MSETTETAEPESNERSKVESWRLHVLIEAGYPLPLAERLAGSEADLHRALKVYAAQSGEPMGALVTEAVTALLKRKGAL